MRRNRAFAILCIVVAFVPVAVAVSQETQSETEEVVRAATERRLDRLEMSHEMLLEWQDKTIDIIGRETDLAIERISRENWVAVGIAAIIVFLGGGSIWLKFHNVRELAAKDFQRYLDEENDKFRESVRDAVTRSFLRTDSSISVIEPDVESSSAAHHIEAFLSKMGYSQIRRCRCRTDDLLTVHVDDADLVLICDSEVPFDDTQIETMAKQNRERLFLVFAPKGRRNITADNVNFANSLITLDHQAISCLQFSKGHAAGFAKLHGN